jgi:hypothetical protein
MHHSLFIIEAGIEVRWLSSPLHHEGRNQAKLVMLYSDQLRCLLDIIFIYIHVYIHGGKQLKDVSVILDGHVAVLVSL